MLVKGGRRVFDPEGFSPRTLSVPHPRSFVGSDGERIWFVVIDGRDPWHSNGTTITETAAVAESLGLVNALNLDGGGSSSIWWSGRIVNLPPGKAVRPVPYALVF
jgi:exopolysaccharide biosynthesis protein